MICDLVVSGHQALNVAIGTVLGGAITLAVAVWSTRDLRTYGRESLRKLGPLFKLLGDETLEPKYDDQGELRGFSVQVPLEPARSETRAGTLSVDVAQIEPDAEEPPAR